MKTAAPRILIVDDDACTASYVQLIMEKEGYRSLIAECGETALKKIPEDSPDVMLLDIMMPGIGGIEVLRQAKLLQPDLPVIMITACTAVTAAVEAMKLGARDYLTKPLKHDQIVSAVRHAVRGSSTCSSAGSPDRGSRLPEPYTSLGELMGPSARVSELIAAVRAVARSDYTVILQGETGTGKELVAREIHHASRRASRPFLAVDCGAIPESLLEGELFGAEKGAFTGAEHQRPGRFELAQGGTILLDEIENLPLMAQAKLLRVIQEKKVYRLGGTRPLPIDIRVLAAGNQDLRSLAASGSFRHDLFYRLNEFLITLPPLRERQEDIPFLADRFLRLANAELNKTIRGFSSAALTALCAFPWPGNVRQLRSTVRRACLLADAVISEHHLDIASDPVLPAQIPVAAEDGSWKEIPYKELMHQKTAAIERAVLSAVLKRTAGNKAQAARILQIDYKTLHTKLKQLGIAAQFKVQG